MASGIDLLIIVIYLLVILAVSIKLSLKETLDGFFVNNRKTRTVFLVFSIVSTTFGAGALIGLAGAAYSTGISFGISNLVTVILGFTLLALIAPKIKRFGDKFGAHTIGDFFAVRFSHRARLLVSALTIIAFFIFTGAQFVAIGSLASVLVGINFTTALFGAALIAIAYTALAGLKGDIYTDFIQFLVMIIAFFAALIPFGILKFGLPTSLPPTHLDPFNFAGPIFFFGSIFLGGLYLLASMDWWQRIYASKDPKQARKIFSWAVILAIPLYAMAIALGLMAASSLGPGLDPDSVLFVIMEQSLPVGLLGLGYAGILAAVMSTVDSMIVVSTASALKDFYKTTINPRAIDSQTLKHARTFAIIFGLAGLGVAYLLPDIVNLVLLSIFIIATFIPATLIGMFWKETTEKAAFWSILIGVIVLMIFAPIAFTLSWLPSFFAALISLIVISKFTRHSKTEKLSKLN